MVNNILLIGFLFFSTNVSSQNNLKIVVNDLSNKKAEKIFITGKFSDWNPGNEKYTLNKIKDGQWEIVLKNLPVGTFNYKFTQGTWETEEVTAFGENIGNHTLEIEKDYSIELSIYGWKNNVSQAKKHTASNNVYLVTDSFYIPQLNRFREVSVYLPQNYYSSKRRYPVLYMHDGQNLFDEFTTPFGEWGVDEALDTLQKQTGKYAIVVAINHGNDKRITEYNFEDNKKYGVAEGKQYVEFITSTLKPFIDKKYRTKKDKTNTAIAGSSLGGLISTYAIMKYPKTFGTAGIFSPAYWIAPSIDSITQIKSSNIKNRFWFYAGEKESSDMINDMERIKNNVENNTNNKILLNVDKNGAHNEQTWRKWFPLFYKWWMGEIKN